MAIRPPAEHIWSRKGVPQNELHNRTSKKCSRQDDVTFLACDIVFILTATKINLQKEMPPRGGKS